MEGSGSRKLRVQEAFVELPRVILTLHEVGFSTIVISCLRVVQWPLGSALTVGLVER